MNNNMEQNNKINPLCNHNLNDENTTIRFSKKKKMVYPNQKDGICVYCLKSFTINLSKV